MDLLWKVLEGLCRARDLLRRQNQDTNPDRASSTALMLVSSPATTRTETSLEGALAGPALQLSVPGATRPKDWRAYADGSLTVEELRAIGTERSEDPYRYILNSFVLNAAKRGMGVREGDIYAKRDDPIGISLRREHARNGIAVLLEIDGLHPNGYMGGMFAITPEENITAAYATMENGRPGTLERRLRAPYDREVEKRLEEDRSLVLAAFVAGYLTKDEEKRDKTRASEDFREQAVQTLLNAVGLNEDPSLRTRLSEALQPFEERSAETVRTYLRKLSETIP